MAQAQEVKESSQISKYDAYFDKVQSRKKLPRQLQENLTFAFSKVPVSSFHAIPAGKVIEIGADTSIADAVKVLSEANILSAPVRNPEAETSSDWREIYLGIIDYSAILLWVLETAQLSAGSISANATAAAGAAGAGAFSAIGAVALGVTGPVAVGVLTAAAVGAVVAGSAVGKIDAGMGENAPNTSADKLGEDFHKVILQDETFKSTTIGSIVKNFRWAPFLPVATNSSMLSVLLLLSKYRMRNVPVIEPGSPNILDFVTQSAVVQGLEGCKGMDWFDCIAAKPISDLGLPFMSSNEVISTQSNDLIAEAFKKMKDSQIGGLPVVEGSKKKIVGNISIKDIRYLLLKPELFSNFRRLTVRDFMSTISTNQEIGKAILPITCSLESPLGNVIHSLASKSVHRIYVTGVEGEVVGVITLRDVISCFIFEPPNHFDTCLGIAVKEILNQF